MKLFDHRWCDGSREFVDFNECASWEELRDPLARLPGAEITGYVTDHVTAVWIDFTYGGHQFSVNNQMGQYWFFVQDPLAPDAVLLAVAEHAPRLLGEPV